MSDSDEKPFEASPQRLEKARREGNVARAGEFGANVAFAGAAAGVLGAAPAIAAAARGAFEQAASGSVPWAFCAIAAVAAAGVFASAAIAGTIAAVLQSGGFAFTPVTAKFERIDPMAGIKRMLSRETLMHSGRSLLAFAVAVGAMLPIVCAAGAQAVASREPAIVAAIVWKAAQEIAFAACGTGLLFAIGEYGAARSAWLRKLRMSFDERKREAREQEGDPLARGRRRALHRSLSHGAVAKVDDAAFVVVNPEHVAVALEYRPPAVAVPRVLVRAADETALRVRDRARERGVPIVENVTLARALYRDARVGDAIAQEHYVTVAEIVVALARAGRSHR